MNSKRKAHRSLLRGLGPLMLTLGLPLSALASPPEEAIQYGDTENTFSSATMTAQTIDMNRTYNRGYKWYLTDLDSAKASATGLKLNSDGSVTLLGDKTGAQGELSSVTPYPGTNGFAGHAFGGGAYIEAVFSYNPAQVTASHNAGVTRWPAFWSLPMEGNYTAGGTWPGQATGYLHNVEVDFFEAAYFTKPTAYGAAGGHDWYGIPNKTCNPGLCKVSWITPSAERDPPAGTVFTQYHTYGVLWVPATASTPGFLDAFFDGKLVGDRHSWTQYTNQAPTPVGKSWAFGLMDKQHLFFILGTGIGAPYTIKSVNVWQKSAADNLVN
jgi:hypothetical protein